MTETQKKIYHGHCHCGAFKFSVQLPELTSGTVCNCSICSKKGMMWVFPGVVDPLVVERGEGSLMGYEWGDKNIVHKFCPTCGTAVLGSKHNAESEAMRIAINIRTLNDVDFWSLKLNTFPGKELPMPYKIPEFTGEEPKVNIEGSKIYTGNCHCGTVTFALKTKPVPEIEVKEDDCTYCSRGGLVLCYPQIPQVSISGAENLSGYQYGKKFTEFQFCKNCGVLMFLKIIGPPKEEVDMMSEAGKAMVKEKTALLVVNLRAMNGVEWEDLDIKRTVGVKDVEPIYKVD